jgi:hypothetical protein
MAARWSPFVARILQHSQTLGVRANVAVEQARHLRMQRFRRRVIGERPAPDELRDAQLRRELGPHRNGPGRPAARR